MGQRVNSREGSPRDAVTPVNAMLNYCYRLAEVETIIAMHTVGLDPSFGIVHTDHPYRNSMALDILEAIRPYVDRCILDFIEYRTFTRKDFLELPNGECQMSPMLRSELSAMMPLWRESVAPVVEHVANLLRPANAVGQKVNRTPLTNLHAKQAQTKMKVARGILDANGRKEDADKGAPTVAPGREQWFSTLHPSVQATSTAKLAHATGLTKRYIKQIKCGQRVPAPRHWPAFQQVASG